MLPLLAQLLLSDSWSIISSTSIRSGVEAVTAREFHFADFTLDQSRYRLQRGEDLLRLEKLPMELLILLVERRGELVSREVIAERLWGKDVFLETDRSINTAISKVRIALRDDPEKPRFIETVVGKGYRFAAPVAFSNRDFHEEQPLPPPAQVASGPAVLPTAKRAVSIRLRVLLGGIVVVTLFTLVLVMTHSGSAKGTRQSAIKSLAVLPLKNLSGDPTQEYLADGMTEELIGRLSSIHDLRVISRTSVMHFKDTQLSVPEIAKALHVDAIVEGSVKREGSRIRVTAQLIRGETDEHFWSESYDRELREALALESDVAQAIAVKVEATAIGKDHAKLTAARAVSPEVFENYLKGESTLYKSNTRAGIEESIGYFEEAIKRDPSFAPAYMGLADAYNDISTVFVGAPPTEARSKVIAAARKALELDPELAEAHVLLAITEQKQWQWSDAEAEYKRALELKPNDAYAHLGLAEWLMCQGRTGEAVEWAQRGRELDPLAVSGSSIAWILFNSRRYDEAIRELRSALAVHPDDAGALWFLGFALIGNGQSGEAIPVLEKTLSIMNRSPGSIEILATAYAHAGRRNDALRLMAELKRRRQKSYVPAGAFINPYLALGDYDQAFVGFERAYQEKSNILQFLKVQPFFDPVRNDPRFKDLVRRVGLPQ